MYKVMGTSYNAITAKGEGIITILVIIMLGLAVCFDLWKSKIPNWLTGMGVMTGYAAHRDDILLAGKTGTAEIKASKDDTSGTELGWFAIFTAEDTVERPILIISMVEDVKGRGGSGYVVKKDKLVLEEWFGSN